MKMFTFPQNIQTVVRKNEIGSVWMLHTTTKENHLFLEDMILDKVWLHNGTNHAFDQVVEWADISQDVVTAVQRGGMLFLKDGWLILFREIQGTMNGEKIQQFELTRDGQPKMLCG